MSAYGNPLSRWRGAELKEPLFKERALLGKRVRKLMLLHPMGIQASAIEKEIPGGASVLSHLQHIGFARCRPGRPDLWFASEPRQPKNEGA